MLAQTLITYTKNPQPVKYMDWDYLHEIYKCYPQQNDATDLLKELDNLLQDWDNFFKLYMVHAPPPDTEQEMIKQWFAELRLQHKKCIKKYNKTLSRALNTNYGEFSLMYGQANLIKKEKSKQEQDEDDVSYM